MTKVALGISSWRIKEKEIEYKTKEEIEIENVKRMIIEELIRPKKQ